MIPNGEIVKVQIKIRSGGFDDLERGWSGGYAKLGKEGAIYLDCEFSVIEGPYSGKKFFSLIGLYSPRGEWWGNNGRSHIRDILNSAHNLTTTDNASRAKKLRKLKNLGQLDNLIFSSKVKIEDQPNGKRYNRFDCAIVREEQEQITEKLEAPSGQGKAINNNETTPMWMS